MFKLIALVIIIFVPICLKSQLKINEIQPAPTTPEPEWLELFNMGSETLDIIGYTLSDAVGTKNIPTFSLCGGAYAILCKDTTALLSLRNIPNETILVQFTLPVFNNDWDMAVIKDADGKTIDSLYYLMSWGTKGKSLERVDYIRPPTSSENLLASINPSGATCGFKNSVAPLEYDLEIEFGTPDFVNACIDVFISNKGTKDAENVKIIISADEKGSLDFDYLVLIKEYDITLINSCEKYIYNLAFDKIYELVEVKSNIALMVQCMFSLDENISNNAKTILIAPPLKPYTILINEFMYDVASDFAEYVELYNQSDEIVNLNGWKIINSGATFEKGGVTINDDSFVIEPKSYCVIGWDSLLFNNFPYLLKLKNTYIQKQTFNLKQASDNIVLYDANGNIQDSMTYFNNWHISSFISTKNISLEKMQPELQSDLKESWSSCSDEYGGTPGKQNSIYFQRNNNLTLSAEPNPFNPRGVGNERHSVISFNLKYDFINLNASIFDLSGTKIKVLANSLYTTGCSNLLWDGTNDSGYILPPGAYVLFFEASDIKSGTIQSEKILLVIGSN